MYFIGHVRWFEQKLAIRTSRRPATASIYQRRQGWSNEFTRRTARFGRGPYRLLRPHPNRRTVVTRPCFARAQVVEQNARHMPRPTAFMINMIFMINLLRNGEAGENSSISAEMYPIGPVEGIAVSLACYRSNRRFFNHVFTNLKRMIRPIGRCKLRRIDKKITDKKISARWSFAGWCYGISLLADAIDSIPQ
jgi:hypothetical protein